MVYKNNSKLIMLKFLLNIELLKDNLTSFTLLDNIKYEHIMPLLLYL